MRAKTQNLGRNYKEKCIENENKKCVAIFAFQF